MPMNPNATKVIISNTGEHNLEQLLNQTVDLLNPGGRAHLSTDADQTPVRGIGNVKGEAETPLVTFIYSGAKNGIPTEYVVLIDTVNINTEVPGLDIPSFEKKLSEYLNPTPRVEKQPDSSQYIG